MFDRATIIDEAFTARVRAHDLPATLTETAPAMADLPGEVLLHLFETQMMSRHLDLMARRSKGRTFYSIGSSGHEGMATLARASRLTDMAFLHYRDGAFLIERKRSVSGQTALYDMALSFAAAAEDPVSGGRHKVLGGADIFVPPQTSTIASHLPRAVGAAHSIALARKLKPAAATLPRDAVILCSFGDASANHSTAQGAINAASWAAWQQRPMPIVFICEDNDIGISVRTPAGWIKAAFGSRPGLTYMACDGRDIADALRGTRSAVDHARRTQSPVFLHMKTVRLMGHAGADIEAAYTDVSEIEAGERNDPLLHTARHVIEAGLMAPEEIVVLYETVRARVARVAADAQARPKLASAGEVMAPLIPSKKTSTTVEAPAGESSPAKTKTGAGVTMQAPEKGKPVPLARHLNLALADLMRDHPEAVVFGEDVGRKGGVYSVTTGLQKTFGPARVLDTLLDEQTILGLALGLSQNGFLPIPEIQFLAYLHNAGDQLRGEAATLPFFSNGQYTNPMVLRIAGLAYQKGFGGHFHNDNSFSALRDIPGIVIACPSHGPEGARMLRECVRLAHEERRVVVFLEPIALYMTADLHEEGDGKWLSPYRGPDEDHTVRFGEIGHHGDGRELCILTYGNGYYLSRKAAKIIAERYNFRPRIIDLRWLHPLPREAILKQVKTCRNVLIVDESRRTGSLSEALVTMIAESGLKPGLSRVTAEDSFIPLGPAATQVLPSVDQIVEAAARLCGWSAGGTGRKEPERKETGR